MRILSLFLAATLALAQINAQTPLASNSSSSSSGNGNGSVVGFRPTDQVRSTNLTDQVQWDGYSLFVQGQRLYLWSGEVHPWRIPVPQLWPDIMQRIKALGFNAISMYTFWALHNPSPGVLDFDGWKGLDAFFQAANEAGLWVVARPGPYINAEVAGGGIPAWVTALNTTLRTSDSVFRDAYTPYWEAVGAIFARSQITNGGPIIAVQVENEYFLSADGDLDLDYIVDLEDRMRSYGIVVPLTFNDVRPEYRLYQGKGAVNIYGVDSYPQNTDCSEPEYWRPVPDYRQYLVNTSGSVGSPFYIPEMQGGWIPGLDTKSYDQCLQLFNSDFERVFYHSNIAQGIKMHSVYLVYGGTNYGHTAFPRGLTSYDYWAAIAEDRSLRDKYYELKTISHFVRHSADLVKTLLAGSSNSSYTFAPNGTIQVDELRNPDTNAGFYVVRHANSSSTDRTSFVLNVQDAQRNVSLPVTLDGRDSRIITTNYCWSTTCLLHSSATIFTNLMSPELDTVIVHGTPDQPYQAAFPGTNITFEQLSGFSALAQDVVGNSTILRFNISSGDHSMIKVNGRNKIVAFHILDTARVHFAWSVVIPTAGDFGNHYGVGSNDTAIAFGPYFVRSASSDNNTLNLYGDTNETTQLFIAAPVRFTNFTWNDVPIHAVQGINLLWAATLAGPSVNISAPAITQWKWRDSLPEIADGFDDSQWVTADHVTTSNPNQPYPAYNGKYVLYLPDYGFAVGNTILRGYFTSSGGNETGLGVSVSAGTGGAAAFWLNGQWIGSAFVNTTEGVEDVNTTISFPTGLVRNSSQNILTIVLDNAALEEAAQFTSSSSDIQSPRGLRGYTLIGGDTSGYEMFWKVQGNIGGWTDFPDKTRGIFNVGGLAGEREGWYLPGFDTGWTDGVEWVDKPGVRFYRGLVEVDYPEGVDVHYSFVFPNATGGYRAQLYVNGWQFGRRYGDLGPQTVFPVPPGILSQGNNTIALSFFAVDKTTASFSLGGALELRVDPVVTTSNLDLRGMKVESPWYEDVYGT